MNDIMSTLKFKMTKWKHPTRILEKVEYERPTQKGGQYINSTVVNVE